MALPGGNHVHVGLPREHFIFTPLVLKAAVVDRYRRIEALRVNSEPGGRGRDLGSIGHEFKALVQGGGSVKVLSEQGRTGWLHLRGLARNRSEAVDFVAGVFRALRGDWSGAPRYLKRVADDSKVAPAIRADALLLLAMCDEQRGRSGLRHIDRAQNLIRDAQPVARYRLAALLADLDRHPGRADTIKARLRHALDRSRYLFDANDSIVGQVTRLL